MWSRMDGRPPVNGPSVQRCGRLLHANSPPLEISKFHSQSGTRSRVGARYRCFPGFRSPPHSVQTLPLSRRPISVFAACPAGFRRYLPEKTYSHSEFAARTVDNLIQYKVCRRLAGEQFGHAGGPPAVCRGFHAACEIQFNTLGTNVRPKPAAGGHSRDLREQRSGPANRSNPSFHCGAVDPVAVQFRAGRRLSWHRGSRAVLQQP